MKMQGPCDDHFLELMRLGRFLRKAIAIGVFRDNRRGHNRGTYSLVSRRINRVFEMSEKLSALAFWRALIALPSPALYAAIANGQAPKKS